MAEPAAVATSEGTATPSGSAEDQVEISQHQADELLARCAWSRLVEPGDRVAGALIERIGAAPLLQHLINGTGAKRICEIAWSDAENTAESRSQVTAALRRWTPRLNRDATLADIEHGIAAGISLLVPSDTAWPESLNDLGAHAPLTLWVRGEPNHLAPSTPLLAVVGARASTGYGAHVTAEIVDGVCGAGVTVVSGAAYGIDAVAHRTALAGDHPTIAVLAGGADRAYPAAHRSLLERVTRSGTVCSEMPPGAAPTRWRFLMRNRIIAALARATLVTEAGQRSGSLNTAGHTAELGRALGAVPGPITSAASVGCHRLLREYGASLVTSAADALELLGIDASLFSAHPSDSEQVDHDSRPPATHQRLLDALPLRGGRTLEAAARHAGLGLDESRGVMAELELLGLVRPYETPGEDEHKWALVRRK